MKLSRHVQRDWTSAISQLDYAFQPIVNINNGSAYGFEALLRGYNEAGFSSIQDVFDSAWMEGSLIELEMALRRKALTKFKNSGLDRCARVFCNIDNRIFRLLDDNPNVFDELHNDSVFSAETVYLEISEKHDIPDSEKVTKALSKFRTDGGRIALDDFGAGYSGLQLLYHAQPNIIKIDRFFIAEIETCSRKKLFVDNITSLAHQMGILVIAEGVETEREFFTCREVGCDMVQGYFVQKPTREVDQMNDNYPLVLKSARADRRGRSDGGDSRLLAGHIQSVAPITQNGDLVALLDRFRSDPEIDFIPVVNRFGEPVGVIREKALKEYVYSPYGISLLKNMLVHECNAFVQRLPVAEISAQIGSILEKFTLSQALDGLIITENNIYKGILSARSLLNIINEKKLAEAREQNPLTRLPGNMKIAEYISHDTANVSGRCFVYFDFDNFKPYNDAYGFRNGDRVILLFSEILREIGERHGAFIGHVGGDDFFTGFALDRTDMVSVVSITKEACRRFEREVVSFYNPEDRRNGNITSHDRDGNERSFSLLTISAAALEVPSEIDLLTPEELTGAIAVLKKEAKSAEDRIVTRRLTKTLGFENNDSNEPDRNSTPSYSTGVCQRVSTAD